jgi:hypothetical protein
MLLRIEPFQESLSMNTQEKLFIIASDSLLIASQDSSSVIKRKIQNELVEDELEPEWINEYNKGEKL